MVSSIYDTYFYRNLNLLGSNCPHKILFASNNRIYGVFICYYYSNISDYVPFANLQLGLFLRDFVAALLM